MNSIRPARSGIDAFLIIPISVCCVLLFAAGPGRAGEIRGHITDAADGAPLPGVNLRLMGTPLGGASDSAGAYAIPGVPAGVYRLEVSLVGYRTRILEDLAVYPDAILRKDVRLRVDVLSLDEIVVTPGRFAVLKNDPVVAQTLSREEVRTMPVLGEDVYRAIGRLPGVSSGDFSARFTIRGGDHDGVLVTLDGLELYEAFHLKDIAGGALSIVDVEVVGGIDMMTGGFSADYGDHKDAVLEMSSRTPAPGRRVSAGIGLMNARILAQGASDRYGWLISARRGYIDLALKLMNEEDEISPDYYDFFGKLDFGNDRHRFGLRVLGAYDHFDTAEEDGDIFDSAYGNGYVWLTWETAWNNRLHVRNLPYAGRITARRDGLDLTVRGETYARVDDTRKTTVYGFKSDWKWEPARAHLLRFGFDVKRASADYDYFNQDFVGFDPEQSRILYEVTELDPQHTGFETGLYIADKWRVYGALTADAGIRFDHHAHTGETRTSPRAALALPLGEQTVLRAAWGRYFQAQSIADLPVQDGITRFRRAEQATHTVLGLERKLGNTLQLRVEAYAKALRYIRDRFDNLDNDIDFMPEVSDTRIHTYPETGLSRGIEIYLKREAGRRLSWWVSYALAQTRETHAPDRGFPALRGRSFLARHDQRHTAALDILYRPSPAWSLSLAWQIRSGWPYTTVRSESDPIDLRYDILDLYGRRYPPFHRLDLKLSRRFTFRAWRLATALELVNLYGRRNVRRYYYTFENGRLIKESDAWLPRLPSITISAEF